MPYRPSDNEALAIAVVALMLLFVACAGVLAVFQGKMFDEGMGYVIAISAAIIVGFIKGFSKR